MASNKRRHGSRPNHLLDVSRGHKLANDVEPPASAVALEEAPLSIAGRSKVVLDPEEYDRLQTAAERAAAQEVHGEDPDDAAGPAAPECADVADEAPAQGEPLESFIAGVDASQAPAPARGADDEVDGDPFEEFARLRPRAIQRTPQRPGSAAITSPAGGLAHARRPARRKRQTKADRSTRRIGWRWLPVAAVVIVAFTVAVITFDGGHGPAPGRSQASEQAIGARPFADFSPLASALAHVTRAVRSDAHRAHHVARARATAREFAAQARQARRAQQRRRRAAQRRAAERRLEAATASTPSSSSDSDQTVSTTSEPTAPSTTYEQPTDSSASDSTSSSSSSSAGQQPAGPTGIGGSTGGCDPKCTAH